jgi:hypothetical protein
MPLKNTWPVRAAAAVCACLILFSIPMSIFAQSSFYLFLYPPDLSDFPKVTLFLDAYDPQGQFIPTMDLNSFTIMENGIGRAVNEVQLIEPGLHTIFALNLGATLSKRANETVPTRFEEAVFAVADWLNGLDTGTQDQYSLTSSEGLLAVNLQDKADFTFRLQNYKPNLFNFQPDFSALNLALETAEKPNLISQSKETIIYITPLPLDQSLDEIPVLQARAVSTGVPVHIWLMAPETASNSPALEALSQLSAATGGTFLHYTEDTALPDPEDFIGRLRNLYRLRYTSEINQSGTHSLLVSGIYGNQDGQSNEVSFNIDLNLPTIYLKDLPSSIDRKYENTGGGRVLQPGVITVAAEVIFPDGYERQLEATRFYVDGEVVAENKEAPFDFFGWPLEEYQFSGEHLVSVEVEDILGFRSISPPVTIMINVESAYPAWITAALRFFMNGGWIIAAVLALGGTAYAGVRLRRRLSNRDQEVDEALNGEIDPLEQSVPGLGYGYAEAVSRSSSGTGRLSRQVVPPRFVWENGSPRPPEKTFEIEQPQVIIGSDPAQSDFTLDSPAVSPQHACLARSESGAVTIADLGSETGTWVNFAPVSAAGTILNDGDLIRIGKVTFRYHIGDMV